MSARSQEANCLSPFTAALHNNGNRIYWKDKIHITAVPTVTILTAPHTEIISFLQRRRPLEYQIYNRYLNCQHQSCDFVIYVQGELLTITNISFNRYFIISLRNLFTPPIYLYRRLYRIPLYL